MRVVLRNEVPNFGRHIQQLQPLLFVQSYRKAAHAIDGHILMPVATRYDKLAANYLAFIKLASIRLWIRAYESTP